MYQRYRPRCLVRLAHFQVFYAVLQTHVAQPYSVRLLRHRAPLSHSLVQNVVLVVSLDKIMRHSLHYLMQVPAVGRKHQRLHFRVMHEISKALHVMLNTQRRHSEVSKMISLTMLHGSHSISVLLLHRRCAQHVYPGASKISYVFSMVSLSVLVAYQHTTSTTDF